MSKKTTKCLLNRLPFLLYRCLALRYFVGLLVKYVNMAQLVPHIYS